ncbi:MAG: alpha/beta fold hydrolase [Dehalococcoidia bacterium]
MALRNDLEDRYVRANGFDIRYIEKGAGRPLICLHGLNGQLSGDQWIVNIDALSGVARVICPDLPGWGLSSLPPEGCSFEGFVETIRAFCDALGLDEVDIAGQSMGGWLAALYAYYHPQRVRRVILVGNAGLNPSPPGLSQTFSVPDRERIHASLTREWANNVDITDAMLDEQERRMSLPGRKESYEAVLHEVHNPDLRAKYSLRDKLPSMQQPILVVWGDNAVGIPLTYGFEAFQLAPNARLAVIHGGDHSPIGITPRDFESQAIRFLTTEDVAAVPKPA